MVKTNTQHVGERLKARNVTTEVPFATVCSDDGRHCIPSHPRTQTFLVFLVAWAVLLERRWNRIHIGRITRKRNKSPRAAGLINECLEDELSTLRPLSLDHSLEGFEPLTGLDLVHIDAFRFTHLGLLLFVFPIVRRSLSPRQAVFHYAAINFTLQKIDPSLHLDVITPWPL